MPGVAPDQVHRERDHRIAHDFAGERDEVIRQIERAVFRHHEVEQRKHHQHDQHESKNRGPAFGAVQARDLVRDAHVSFP